MNGPIQHFIVMCVQVYIRGTGAVVILLILEDLVNMLKVFELVGTAHADKLIKHVKLS